MDDKIQKIENILNVFESIQCNVLHTNIELEARMCIPPPTNFIDYETITIQYYKSQDLPTLTIRKEYGKDYIETKELVDRVIIENINIVCSVEKRYRNFDYILNKHILRKIDRLKIQDNPLVVINRENNIYMLEVEFERDTLSETIDILNSYSVPFWPCVKPQDAYASEILSNIDNNILYISPKYDGEHAVMYLDTETRVICIIKDNGEINMSNSLDNFDTVYEVELVNTDIFILDIMMYKNVKLTDNNYLDRLKYAKYIQDITHNYIVYNEETRKYISADIIKNERIPENICSIKLKNIYKITDYDSLRNAKDNIYNISAKIDGVILTNEKGYYNTVYKSKPNPTVDLQYINGYLYLARETNSQRISHIELEEGCIYEFDINLNPIRKREDKLIPNYYMPVKDDVIDNICTGHGIPCLRYHHNKIKLIMLKKFNGILLDIGSGLGGDISKWDHFTKVYAIDPETRLRNVSANITFLRCKVQDIKNIYFDIVSIFFVPWCNDFIKFMLRSKHALLIIMDKPSDLDSDNIKITKLENNMVNINIPNTSTASNITEEIPDIKNIDNIMIGNGYKKHDLTHKYNISFATKEEKELSKMYTYIIYSKIM